ncbi:MAG: hypothetical protein ACRC0G_01635 [Fusobacteriaceae bacterium]
MNMFTIKEDSVYNSSITTITILYGLDVIYKEDIHKDNIDIDYIENTALLNLCNLLGTNRVAATLYSDLLTCINSLFSVKKIKFYKEIKCTLKSFNTNNFTNFTLSLHDIKTISNLLNENEMYNLDYIYNIVDNYLSTKKTTINNINDNKINSWNL